MPAATARAICSQSVRSGNSRGGQGCGGAALAGRQSGPGTYSIDSTNHQTRASCWPRGMLVLLKAGRRRIPVTRIWRRAGR